MTTQQTKQVLIHAATAWNIKQSKRKGHNPYALGIYFERIDAVCQDIESGTPLRQALLRGFNDRLLSHMLKAVGKPDFTAQEMAKQSMTY